MGGGMGAGGLGRGDGGRGDGGSLLGQVVRAVPGVPADPGPLDGGGSSAPARGRRGAWGTPLMSSSIRRCAPLPKAPCRSPSGCSSWRPSRRGRSRGHLRRQPPRRHTLRRPLAHRPPPAHPPSAGPPLATTPPMAGPALVTPPPGLPPISPRGARPPREQAQGRHTPGLPGSSQPRAVGLPPPTKASLRAADAASPRPHAAGGAPGHAPVLRTSSTPLQGDTAGVPAPRGSKRRLWYASTPPAPQGACPWYTQLGGGERGADSSSIHSNGAHSGGGRFSGGTPGGLSGPRPGTAPIGTPGCIWCPCW